MADWRRLALVTLLGACAPRGGVLVTVEGDAALAFDALDVTLTVAGQSGTAHFKAPPHEAPLHPTVSLRLEVPADRGGDFTVDVSALLGQVVVAHDRSPRGTLAPGGAATARVVLVVAGGGDMAPNGDGSAADDLAAQEDGGAIPGRFVVTTNLASVDEHALLQLTIDALDGTGQPDVAYQGQPAVSADWGDVITHSMTSFVAGHATAVVSLDRETVATKASATISVADGAKVGEASVAVTKPAWSRLDASPVVIPDGRAWDAGLNTPWLLRAGPVQTRLYVAGSSSNGLVDGWGVFDTANGTSWAPPSSVTNPIYTAPTTGSWDASRGPPGTFRVVRLGAGFIAIDSGGNNAQPWGVLTSIDGIGWTEQGTGFRPGQRTGCTGNFNLPTCVFSDGGNLYVFFAGANAPCVAVSSDGGKTFSDETLLDGFPITSPARIPLALAVAKEGSVYKMWYAANDGPAIDSYATSSDLQTWTPSTSGLIDVPLLTVVGNGDGSYTGLYAVGSGFGRARRP